MKAAATQKTALRKHNNYVIKASWGGVHRMATPHKRRKFLHILFFVSKSVNRGPFKAPYWRICVVSLMAKRETGTYVFREHHRQRFNSFATRNMYHLAIESSVLVEQRGIRLTRRSSGSEPPYCLTTCLVRKWYNKYSSRAVQCGLSTTNNINIL